MKKSRPGLKKRGPRPAPIAKAQLRSLRQGKDEFQLVAVVPPLPYKEHEWRLTPAALTAAELQAPGWFVRWVRTLGAHLIRFRVPRRVKA